jgi:hypothetical protein
MARKMTAYCDIEGCDACAPMETTGAINGQPVLPEGWTFVDLRQKASGDVCPKHDLLRNKDLSA